MQTGGANSFAGAISELTLSTRAFVNRASFNASLNGSSPKGNLVKSTVNGKYYGLASGGGSGNFGTIYEFDPILDTIINKHNFSPSNKGKTPTGTLVKAPNGKLYGITEKGGTSGNGTIFEVDPVTHNVVKKINFDESNGKTPAGGLTLATNGKLYGVTTEGGASNRGILYEYNITTNIVTKLKDFAPLGSNPRSALMQASNGKLYGVTNAGGARGHGMLYSYDITLDSLVRHDDFDRNKTGGYSYSKLMQATSGKLYGTTVTGGASNNKGTVFEFDITHDSIRVFDDFSDSNGASPYGGLIQTANGNIYGMTIGGNVRGIGAKSGVIYQLDLIADTIKPLVTFIGSTNGFGGFGELLEASNGKMYLTSRNSAGGNSEGILNRFDPVTHSLVALKRLPGETYGSLIELVSPNNASINENELAQKLSVYPNPTNSILNLDTKGEKIESVRVFTISGQLITVELNADNTMDVSNLKNGLYIIQVKTNNGVALSRFIKQ